jgi:hypothetical protein
VKNSSTKISAEISEKGGPRDIKECLLLIRKKFLKGPFKKIQARKYLPRSLRKEAPRDIKECLLLLREKKNH